MVLAKPPRQEMMCNKCQFDFCKQDGKKKSKTYFLPPLQGHISAKDKEEREKEKSRAKQSHLLFSSQPLGQHTHYTLRISNHDQIRRKEGDKQE